MTMRQHMLMDVSCDVCLVLSLSVVVLIMTIIEKICKIVWFLKRRLIIELIITT